MMNDLHAPSSNSPAQSGGGGGGGVSQDGLKMTISLKQKTPFYLMRPDPTPANETTGATNLMAARGLEHSYNKLTTKKMKETLSSFLPNLPGDRDTPGSQDNSSLRGIIEKPPVTGKELHPLNQLQLAGFRLHPGPLPEEYRALAMAHTQKRRHKTKKHKYRMSSTVPGASGGETPVQESALSSVGVTGAGERSSAAAADDAERERKREKKHKRHEKDDERKKKKKEKKKKRNKEEKD